MFRVFVDGKKPLEFLSYGEFAAYRLRVAAAGMKPRYVCKVRLGYSDYIYCYHLEAIRK